MTAVIQHVFAALADPARRQIIEILTNEGAKTATQLAPVLEITRQGITKHLGILEEAGLVIMHQRGRNKFYYLSPDPLQEASLWMATIAARWDQRLAALSDWLDETEGD